MRRARGDHHVVDRRRCVAEELCERARVGGVERHDPLGIDFARGGVESLAIAAGEDHLGAIGAGLSRRLEPDASTSADHDDALSREGDHRAAA